jgi:catechol 2,3-dioxygenase-like lactoylglutathione lyase family enzyme
MLDHMILTVSDVERSLAFYEAALKPLSIKFFLPYKGEGDHPDLWGFGDGKRAFFWLKQGKPNPASIHWGFMGGNNDTVDEFYSAAISAGARDNISPRVRAESHPGYYAADVFDPDGYSFEVVHKASEEPHIGKIVTARLGHKHWLRSSDRSSANPRVTHPTAVVHGNGLLAGGLEC